MLDTTPPFLAAVPPRGADLVRLFEHEPDLLDGVDERIAHVLRERAVVERLWLDRGTWQPPIDQARSKGWVGLLVLDGLLTRSVRVGDRAFPELVGAGDILRPWDEDPSDLAPADANWQVLVPGTVALLDRRFAAVAARCPEILGALLGRCVQRTREMATTMAMSHDRHADSRLRMLLWRLADRWGRVTSDGVLVPLPLTHEMLAQLSGLRRPTASTTLTRLSEAGEVERRRNGWLLTGERPVAMETADDEVVAVV